MSAAQPSWQISRFGAPLVAITALLDPLPSPAGGTVDQVERLDIERGAIELEGQAILIDRSERTDFQFNATFEFGISDALQAGIEVETVRGPGDSLAVKEIGLQAKLIALDPEAFPVGLGLQPTLAIDRLTGRVGSETFFIAESRFGAFDFAANIVLETEPGHWSDTETRWGGRLDYGARNALSIGIEGGGGLSGEDAGSQFAGPAATYSLGEDAPSIEFGAFLPLSSEAPGLQLRLEIDAEF